MFGESSGATGCAYGPQSGVDFGDVQVDDTLECLAHCLPTTRTSAEVNHPLAAYDRRLEAIGASPVGPLHVTPSLRSLPAGSPATGESHGRRRRIPSWLPLRVGGKGVARGSWREQVFGARSSHDVREGRVFDGLVLGGEASVVLALVLLPGRHLELLQEQVRVVPRPGTGPTVRHRCAVVSGASTPWPAGSRPPGRERPRTRWTPRSGRHPAPAPAPPAPRPSRPAGRGPGAGSRAPSAPGPRLR